ncbi:flagellar motor protein MotB [Sphingomonas sp. Mn802worker]|uniref:flagellar motor protein MotB n=1 Tax=Sphingomonas sp. Mn802worker TaxID=629773 RepID=UPI00039F95EB|nr:flagellar motor protein MotB [Sphingomonas sp. Mn802worker]
MSLHPAPFDEDFPPLSRSRPLWLITLADLALLLVGFFVLLEANRQLDPRVIARAVSAGLGVEPPPLAVAAQIVPGFERGSARVPVSVDALAAWARAELRDPRVALRVSGSTDGSTSDVDPASGSAALLATDRARAVAAALAAAGVPIERTQISNADAGTRPARHVLITLAFVGEEGTR